MMISFRQALYQSAGQPNKYPWNVGDASKDPVKGNPEESPGTQTIVDLKMDPERLKIDPALKNFQNWEMLNQLGTHPSGGNDPRNPKPHNEQQKRELTDVNI